MHLSSLKPDQIAELLRLLPFIIGVLLFLRGQGKRGQRRTTRPTAHPTSAMPPMSKPAAYQTTPAAKSDEPSIWAKDYDHADRWGLPAEEWGDAFGDKWKSAFDEQPAPPKRPR